MLMASITLTYPSFFEIRAKRIRRQIDIHTHKARAPFTVPSQLLIDI